MRITKPLIESIENALNRTTKNVNLKVERRYGYYAIDIEKKDHAILDVLEAGLTARETYLILKSVLKVLALEK